MKTKFPLTTISAIKQAVDNGNTVYAGSKAYQVIKDKIGQYLINHVGTDWHVGLHGQEGTKYENALNGYNFFMEVQS